MAIVLMESIVGPFRHPPLMSTTELAAVLEAAGAYKGKSTLRSAIPRVRERVASPQESHLRLRIVASGLPEPRVAAPVHLPGHPDPIHPDLSDEDAMIAIEYDGSGHWGQEQRAYDARRYAALSAAGRLVLTVTKGTQMPRRLDDLDRHLRERRGMACRAIER